MREQQQQSPTPNASTSGTGNPQAVTYRDQAAAVIAKLAEVEAMIPGYEQANRAGRKLIRPYRRVPAQFIRDAISAVDEAPHLGVGIIDSDVLRDRKAFADEFGVVRDRLAAVAANADYTVGVADATVGAACQKVYGATMILARDPRATVAAVHARTMKISRGLLRKHKPQQSPDETPGQSPTPAPQPDSAPHELKQVA